MKILVTGGAGYIGSHTVRLLQQSGHKVIALDNLSHGHREALARIKAELIVGDVGNEELVEQLLRTHSIEAVVHFAADIEVGESVADPDKYYRNNFVNALSLLRVMRQCEVKKIVFSSTAAVYGDPESGPILETHPLRPMSPYGRSKMMVELALEDFCRAYGIGSVALRYFNVAGASSDSLIGEAHEPESHLIPRILASAQSSAMPFSIFGTDYPTADGTCVRDYIHVEDLAAAHLLALENLQAGERRFYNLGSESGFSVREVLAVCEEVSGKKLKVTEHGRRPGDPATLVASSAKIRTELGWQRKYPDLKTIVTHAWNWHRQNPFGYLSASHKLSEKV